MFRKSVFFAIFAIYKDKTILRHSQIHLRFLFAIFASLVVFWQPCKAQNNTIKTVCIDAGHGGHDGGCTRKDGGKTYREKDITLDVAKELARQISSAYPDVTVVLTRSTDVYVTLSGRGKIANDAKADLFISIHIDATKNTSAKGFSIHCLGQSRDKNRDLFKYNMDVCRRENAVFSLDEDKPAGFDPDDPASAMVFSLMQNVHLEQSLMFAEDVQKEMRKGPIKTDRGVWQNPFQVLWVTSMPAVLIECGFLSNDSDRGVFKTKEGKEKIAASIFRAFKTYKTRFDSNAGNVQEGQSVQPAQPVKEEIIQEEEPKKAEEASKDNEVLYGVQVMASGKLLSKTDKTFKGHKVTIVKTGKLYKYILDAGPSEKKARENLKTIKKTFPEAFLVKTDGNYTEMVK